MPTLSIYTNVTLDSVKTSAALKEASKVVAKTLGKPEQYMMVILKGGVPMCFGGTEEPSAYGELSSIGGLDPEQNKSLSELIANILETKLAIPKSRFYIKFYDAKRSDFGWNGSTF